jgi:hypothetical protein
VVDTHPGSLVVEIGDTGDVCKDALARLWRCPDDSVEDVEERLLQGSESRLEIRLVGVDIAGFSFGRVRKVGFPD